MLKRYRDWSPTHNDPKGLGCDDQQDWFVAPVMLTRDSGIRAESNFESFKKSLESLGLTEPGDFEIHRFGHWGPGWFEIILINPESEAAVKDAEETQAALADYPILDDSDYSEREHGASCEAWSGMSIRERVKLCREAGISVFAARRDEVPDNNRVWARLRPED